MKIALGTVDVSDDEREAIAYYYGQRGMASRDQCRGFIVRNGTEAIFDQQRTMDDERERHT